MNKWIGGFLVTAGAVSAPDLAWAVDSYRYLHVTPETPWYIFLFLLPIVVSPFILMAILYWYFAWHKSAVRDNKEKE
ncbi:MAG: hypothetical protein IT488_07365 [Gammaproteobacteria bacterium]|nr:hypothetical protein [Gammaproteobacteria bacterium]